jgi:hypothetical protein
MRFPINQQIYLRSSCVTGRDQETPNGGAEQDVIPLKQPVIGKKKKKNYAGTNFVP